MKPPTILLIHPPATSSAMPSWDAAVVAGSLAGSRIKPVHYDANLDFFLNHLLSQEQVYIHFQKIQEKKRSGKISNEKYHELKIIYESVCESEIDLNGVRKQEFFDPQWFISFKKKMNEFQMLASQAYFPNVFHRAAHEPGPGISYPGNIFSSKGLSFSGGGRDNPFVQFCEQGLKLEIEKHDPDTIILFVSSPDQSQAAETMADYIKAHFPGIRVLAMTKSNNIFQNGNGFDQVIQGQGLEGLDRLTEIINKHHGTRIDPNGSIPDFSGMPIDQYLIPGLILPVHPLFFKDRFCLSEFLEAQVEIFGVQGFMFLEDSPLSAGPDGLWDNANSDYLEQGDVNYSGRICELLDHWFSIKYPKTFFSIPIQISEQFSDELQGFENKLTDLFSSGLTLIHWKWDNKKAKIPKKILWAASKQGIWNHVTGPNLFRDPSRSDQPEQSDPVRFIANNPNIVHSYQDTALDFSGDEYGNIMPGSELMDYGKVKPLAGTPFWKYLEDPAFLLMYLNRLTRKSLGCLRADIPKQSLLTLGSQMKFFYQSPSDLPPGILDEICKMVDAGGSVDSKYVRSNLEKAYLIGYAMENGVILGNSCLKHPRKEFIQRINQISDFDFTDFVERGYTSVRPECRSLGVGARLLEGLTKRAGDRKVFSIISEDNLATQKIALRNNTRKLLVYFSEKLGKKTGIWMPEHMIDKNWELEKREFEK